MAHPVIEGHDCQNAQCGYYRTGHDLSRKDEAGTGDMLSQVCLPQTGAAALIMIFKEAGISSQSFNPFEKIGSEWMLITAGDEKSFNSMTASWGGFGNLWNRNAAFIFVRPERYTYEFIKKHDFFSLSFFDEIYREQLYIMGNASGRDSDKVKECNFTPVFDKDCVYYEQASLVFKCRKIYFSDLTQDNMDAAIKLIYSNGAKTHKMFIAEIVKILVKEQ